MRKDKIRFCLAFLMCFVYSGTFAQTTTGHVTTLYYGYKAITTKWTGAVTKYKLIDESRGNGIQTIRHHDWFLFNEVNPVLNDGDNTWDDDYEKKIHGSSHWAVQRVWDYFATVLSRNGPDGNGKGILVITDSDEGGLANICHPSLEPMEIILKGPVSGECNPRVSLNAVGHEFTHGVMLANANMSFENPIGQEAEAILEGYCDVFGEFIEYDHQGWVDWKYDAESWINQNNMRAFHPPIFNGSDAMSYGDNNWTAHPEAHFRAGVLRHWVHLLSVGEWGYCIEPLGIKKVENILYKVLIQGHLNNMSTFADLRAATINVATSEYGYNSIEIAQVASAWHALGVGSAYVGQINIMNKTFSTPTNNYAYNNRVYLANDVVGSSGVLNVSSATEIHVAPQFSSVLGSSTRLFIAPGCAGGARLFNANSDIEQNAYSQSSFGTGTKTEIESEVILAPNPGDGLFSVKNIKNNSVLISIDVQNMQGILVKQIAVTNPKNEIDIRDQLPGLYLVKLNYSDKTVIKKVIKQ